MNTSTRVHGIMRRSACLQCVRVYVLRSPATTAMEVSCAQATEEREVKTESRAVPEVFRTAAPVKSQPSCVVSSLHTCLPAACPLPARMHSCCHSSNCQIPSYNDPFTSPDAHDETRAVLNLTWFRMTNDYASN